MSQARRRVVVTRAAGQADDLARLVRDAGYEPVVVPLIDIVDQPQGLQRLHAAKPATFDWLVVTSPNGAAAYRRLHAGTRATKVAAIGSTTATALESSVGVVDLVPSVQSAEGLLAEFPHGPGSVLVVQAVDASPELVEGLTARGFDVTATMPYRSVPANPSPTARAAALNADAVLFASGSAARGWVQVFGTTSPAVAIAIGDKTASAARDAGLSVTAVATDHSLAGLVATLSGTLPYDS